MHERYQKTRKDTIAIVIWVRSMMQFMMKHPSFVTKKAEVGTKILEPEPDITSPDMVLTHADIEKL